MNRNDDDYDPVVVGEYDLDRQWQAQPRLMKNACRTAAEAKSKVALCKTDIKVFEAETRAQIRKHYDQYGFSKKPSIDEVEDTLVTHPGWIKHQRKLIGLQEEQDYCDAEVTALSHKKAALENAVILWCRDYGSEPKVGREHNEAARDKLRQKTEARRYDGHKGTSGDAYNDRDRR